ncbi:type II secretion system minor pseudopilin GspJ [Kordiimonas aestuarii]|uniref:type II secretion system minor pseudopilin GspJ n=1 Tax=Kordiimonas aestuarii TaxID=1005925 RepID=UPI0021D1550D|nr:type II secretion system minor pseudopilin GspJ [Kordiimonas aestuarii]
MTRGDAGFSLVETMVAMLIFAFVSASGVALLVSFNAGERAMAVADDFMADIQTTKSLMRSDLAHALPRTTRDAAGGVLPVFTGGMPAARLVAGAGDISEPFLRFVRGGHLAALVSENAPAVQRVEYIFEGGSLIRRSFARPDVTPDTPATHQVLLSDVDKIRVRFRMGDVWVLDWQGKAGERGSMPKLVELECDITGRGTLRMLLPVGAQI